MSRTFALCCEQCEVHLWIGQGSARSPFYVYTAEPHAERLASFLVEHAEHPLQFMDTEKVSDDSREITFEDDDDESLIVPELSPGNAP